MTAVAHGLSISAELSLPANAVTEAIAALGRRGAGKTTFARVLVEEMVSAGLHVVVLDPLGAFWGLRSSADGLSDGLPITILGGDHGDLPLESTAGKVVADVCVETTGPIILDLSAFESDAAEKRFVTDFAEHLYRAKSKARAPLHLIVDEADKFAPQQIPKDREEYGPRMLGAFEAIVRRGRIRGLGVTLITQRPAVLNKNVLTQTECLIAMQVTSPQDREAIESWVAGNGTPEERKELVGSLASLDRGEAFVYSPAWLRTFQRVKIRAPWTFDSSRTPEVGDIVVEPQQMARVDLESLRSRMAATIERAKADDPRELKRRIVELERQLKAKPTERVIERVEVPVEVVPEGLVKTLRGDLEYIIDQAHAILNRADEACIALQHAPSLLEIQPVPTAPMEATEPLRSAPVSRPRLAVVATSEGVSAPQQRVLDAIARLNGAGIVQPTRQTIAAIAGYSWRSGGFANIVSALRTAGLVEYPTPAVVVLTEEGQKAARSVDPIETVAELHEAWLALLPLPAQKLLRVLIDRYPAELTRQQLADLTGYSAGSGGFANLVGKLHTFGAADYPSRGTVRAADLLFPEGL